MIRAHRRKQGMGVMGVLLVLGLLYFTGAGAWLWNRVKDLDNSCYALLAQIGANRGGEFCAGMGRAINRVDEAAAGFLQRFRDNGEAELAQMGDAAREVFARVSNGNTALAGLASGSEKLEAMLREGPQRWQRTAGDGETLRQALDQFVVGQQLLRQAEPGEALAWFRQSAEYGGDYGLLSQLALGDMYRTGSGNIGPNNILAARYYRQANESIRNLQTTNTPQARQLLQSLPASPDQIRAQLRQILAQLRKIQG